MTNFAPLSGAANASGGYLLPPEQGEILVNGLLVETGAIQLAGDARATTSRKTNFPIWLGRPTAGPVGEGGKKPVTGAGFGQTTMNVKKFASIVLFTDEQIADLQNGDLNVLVDAGVRQALSLSIDAHAVGAEEGVKVAGSSVFDSNLLGAPIAPAKSSESVTTNTGAAEGIIIPKEAEAQKQGMAVQAAVSAARGKLEANGYGNPADIGILLGFGFQQTFRDARDNQNRPLYDGGTYAGQSIDPLYTLTRGHSTNLVSAAAAEPALECSFTSGSPKVSITTRGTAALSVGQPITLAGKIPANSVIRAIVGKPGAETEIELGKWENGAIVAVNAEATAAGTAKLKRQVGCLVHRPNIHVRLRSDIEVRVSNEASIEIAPGETVNLFEQNLHAILYETRLGYMVHDQGRCIVPLYF